ncbi:hypothetical protein [Bacillus subtilis]|uniref:Helicase C-terminal domain-containing protein n=1 Tax=Bacillus subtilis TaxID=1423 RepID=A0A8I1WFT9_BACIU|nr:hypothetical protein [Bacillus subtilis]MBO3794365.1 hypothetical protein [Bacillus subtilis]
MAKGNLERSCNRFINKEVKGFMPSFTTDEIYTLQLYNRGAGLAEAYCDLIVLDDSNNIYLANVIGSDTKVKLLAVNMQEGKAGEIHRAEGNRYENEHTAQNVYAINTRKNAYDEELIKIDDMTQILIISKNAKPDLKARNEWQVEENRRLEEGLEPRSLPASLSELILAWDGNYKKQVFEVLSDRYNTPMLEEWSDYIVDSLIERSYYEPLKVMVFGGDHKLEAGLLRVTEEQLEEIITEGIEGLELDFAIEEDGRDESEAVLPQCRTIDDYLTHFAGELGARIQENIALRFNPDQEKHHPAFRDLNLQANTNGITGYYPPQANTMMGVSETLKEDNFCFLIGEMGTGKTPQGAGIPYLTEAMLQNVEHNPKPQRVIVMSPAIMVEKWAREIKERIPNCETYQITHWLDVKEIQEKYQYIDDKGKIKYKKPDKWEYYIMSSEAPKFTFPLEPIKDWRTNKEDITFESVDQLDESQIRTVRRGNSMHRVPKPEHRIRLIEQNRFNYESSQYETFYLNGDTGFYCPKCGGPLTKRGGDMSETHFFETYNRSSKKFVKKISQENYLCTNEVETKYLPKEEILEWKKDKSSGRYVPAKTEQKCGFVLWQPEKLPPDSGYRKVSPAWYINKQLPRGFFKYLIADEVHEYKSGDSSTGRAFGQLVNHTEKQILLTGTLMGGMSRDIFYLLARLNPKALLKEGITYKDESVFNNRYGISEHNTRGNNGVIRKNSSQKPGISPHLFPLHLMSNCAFLELNDMGYALPPYQEIPVVVDMDEEHALHYREIGHDIMSTMRSTPGLGGMNSISIFMNVMYQYADMPFNMSQVTAHDQSGAEHVLGIPHNYDINEYTPQKVEQLIRTLDEEIYQHGRKNLVYVKYTGKQAFNQVDIYLYEKLKSLGYKVGILRNGGSHDGIKMPRNSRQREEWLNKMMEKHDWDILITNPRLVKVGLDLLAFPNIHFFQIDYSTYDYMQASRRSWRLKQTKDVKVYTYVYRNTIQEKSLQHIARKIDAAMAMQGKFSEEGLRAMADSSDGMNALAKQLMKDEVLEDLETVHDMFARKNQSFEEMQTVEFQDYDGYVMNPIEGGMETVRKIAEGLITHMEEEEKAGRVTKEQVQQTKKAVSEYMDMFDQVIKTVEDVDAYNKGISKKKKIIEGQQELDLFAV